MPADPAAGAEWVAGQAEAHPALAERYAKLSDLCTRKLWHQLTDEVSSFVNDPACQAAGADLAELYGSFVKTFETRISQLALVRIAVAVSKSHADKAAATSFLQELAKEEERIGKEAHLLCVCEIAKLHVATGRLADAQITLASRRSQVEGLVGAAPVVYAAFYAAAAAYHKVSGPPQDFYSNALMMLAYSPMDEMEQADRHELARDLALAALAGREIFNFGEVIATPILGALDGTPEAWLSELLHALHRGDIDGFNQIVAANEAAFAAQPALSAERDFIKEKAALLCLTELLFQRPSHERTVPFADIARATRMDVSQVEWMMMRAMSLKLLKGTIDQVEQQVSVTWVVPRVLDKTQIALLKERLQGWGGKVEGTLHLIQDETHELFQ